MYGGIVSCTAASRLLLHGDNGLLYESAAKSWPCPSKSLSTFVCMCWCPSPRAAFPTVLSNAATLVGQGRGQTLGGWCRETKGRVDVYSTKQIFLAHKYMIVPTMVAM